MQFTQITISLIIFKIQHKWINTEINLHFSCTVSPTHHGSALRSEYPSLKCGETRKRRHLQLLTPCLPTPQLLVSCPCHFFLSKIMGKPKANVTWKKDFGVTMHLNISLPKVISCVLCLLCDYGSRWSNEDDSRFKSATQQL